MECRLWIVCGLYVAFMWIACGLWIVSELQIVDRKWIRCGLYVDCMYNLDVDGMWIVSVLIVSEIVKWTACTFNWDVDSMWIVSELGL